MKCKYAYRIGKSEHWDCDTMRMIKDGLDPINGCPWPDHPCIDIPDTFEKWLEYFIAIKKRAKGPYLILGEVLKQYRKYHVIVVLTALFLSGCYPALKTPESLAKWSGCRPDYIADWIGAMTRYEVQKRYEPAEKVMARGTSDCKGRAVIAIDTLKACGYKAQIIQLSNPRKPADHVIAIFTMPNGRRGFINSSQYGEYEGSKSWLEIIKDVDDGEWIANFATEE